MECFLEWLKEWGTSIAAAAAVIALFLNWHATRENRKTRELQILYTIFKDIRDLEEKQGGYNGTEERKQLWNSLFFNTLEYFSFLLNRKMISEKSVVAFFGDSIKAWYRELFAKKASPEQIGNPTIYPELKSLYKKLTRKK